jgi:nitrite reductase/ring-hydroxylating ferredoxin subunit
LFFFAPMSVEKQYKWHKVAESTAEITQRGSRTTALVKAAGKEICIAFHKDSLKACVAKCPHAGAYMHEGWVDALGNIVCPLHRYKFSLTNGRNVSGEGYHLKTYPVKETDDGVFVGIEVGVW